MLKRTLARHALPGIAAGWAHPAWYSGPLAASVFFADGGDGGDGDGDGGDGTGDGSDTDSGGDGSGDDATDWKAEAEKWKTQARKHEQRAKENRTAVQDLAKLKRDGLPEQERLIAEADAKARAEERAKVSGRLARQAFLAAAKGRVDNAAEVADDVNLSRYVDEQGEVDEDGLAELVDRLAPTKSDTGEEEGRGTRRGRGFDQGARGSGAGKTGSVASGRDLWAERRNKTTAKT